LPAKKKKKKKKQSERQYLQEDGLRKLAKLEAFEVFRELISVQPMHLGASVP
jgi:hypothetical protein